MSEEIGLSVVGTDRLIGPVICVALHCRDYTRFLKKDSKIEISNKKIEEVVAKLDEASYKEVYWSVNMIVPEKIDSILVTDITNKAIASVKFNIGKVIINHKGLPSILANYLALNYFDRVILNYDFVNNYEVRRHFGRSTKEHIESIYKYGLSPYHKKEMSIKAVLSYCKHRSLPKPEWLKN